VVVNGEPVELLLGLRNVGDSPIRLAGLSGRFTQPSNYDHTHRNITRMPYYGEILAGEETTVMYRFATDVEPGEIGLAVDFEIANDQNQFFQVSAFRGNLKVAEPVVHFDFQIVFVYVALLGLLAGTGLLVKQAFFGGAKKVGKQNIRRGSSGDLSSGNEKTKAAADASSKGYDASWIPQQHLQNRKRK